MLHESWMNVPDHTSEPATPTADADLVLRTRSGDADAFGELWRRHHPSGLAVARSITPSLDPDDLVQESFTRIYNAILKGGGPNGSFRAYLFTSIRNTAAAWGKARRETAIDEMDAVPDPSSTDQATEEALDRGLTAQAFRSLPSRWQEVLWYTEIEQMKPAEVAPLLGMRAGAVSQLALRAREGLREAWIQAHLQNAADGSECQWTIEHLGAYSRGNLSARDLKRLELHLDECARCMIVAAEAKDVSGRLAIVLLPLVLGITGSAGYLATLQGAGTSVVALAMPAGVVSAGSAHAEASAVGAIGESAAGGSGASGGVNGIGALVAAGSAALVVAGIVAAAAIVPGLTGSPAMTSLPTASDSADSSAIDTKVQPDETLSPEPAPSTEKPVTDDDRGEEPVPAPFAPPVSEEAMPPPVVSAPPQRDTEPGPEPAQSSEPSNPTDPGEPTDPGPTDPGPTGPGDDPAAPAAPTEPAAIVSSEAIFDVGDPHLHVAVSGLANATVRALIRDASTDGDTRQLDENGAALLDVRPTLSDVLLNEQVTIEYVINDEPQLPVTRTLAELGADALLHAFPGHGHMQRLSLPGADLTIAPAEPAATVVNTEAENTVPEAATEKASTPTAANATADLTTGTPSEQSAPSAQSEAVQSENDVVDQTETSGAQTTDADTPAE